MRKAAVSLLLLALVGAFAWQTPPARVPTPIEDAFTAGWMLTDTNGDGIADFIRGKIVVPEQPTAAENAAAANLAARAGFASTGLTPPLVVSAGSMLDGPRIWVGKAAPASPELARITERLEKDEGGVFLINGNLALVGGDDAGLAAAAEAYAARAPYIWRPAGEKLSAITEVVGSAELVGVTYLHGKAGIHRALLAVQGSGPTTEALAKALESPRLTSVHAIEVISGVSAVSSKPEAAAPPARPAAAGDTAPAGATAAGPTRLDLATLYTSRGLFGSSGRIPVPATSNAHLYVPAGAAGIAMANLAARMGLETTGITLPIASPADAATARDLTSQAVLAGDSALSQAAWQKLRARDTAAAQSETPLASGEGEARIVDDAFGRRAALVVRGDAEGASAALDLLCARFPNLWDYGKQHLSLEEIRYDLHRFFSLRSGGGQAAAALYHLDRWKGELSASARYIKAEVYVDLADPALANFIKQQIPNSEVIASSLRAGSRCCDRDPNLHYDAPGMPFHQGAPDFSEDITIPWEGTRLINAVKSNAAKITPGQDVKLVARVSEGPQQRRKLEVELKQILSAAGADPRRCTVEVLCAYKQGYSWLMDEIAPALAGKPVASVSIEFARNVDPTGIRAMHSEARWVHELYPVDEMLARKLNLPLEKISLAQFERAAGGPTYRVHAFDAVKREILTRDFTVSSVMQPYNGVIPRYEQVQVETGWVKLEAASKVLLNQRIRTDVEEFWDHYQNKTLPRVYQFVMAQANGELRPEFSPPFDTLKLDIHMSEPDYSLDLDRERISSLEALQEDTFYSTAAFVGMMGDLETGRPIAYTGRIIPIVHSSEDGKDGRVHIEFYAKAAANPLVRLSWTDAQGRRHKMERNLPALTADTQPRLIGARIKAGESGVERLLWNMPADFLEDRYDDWLKLEGQDQVDRTILSVERARGQLAWIQKMHAGGLYRDELAWPHLREIGMEFELPLDRGDKPDNPPKREYVSWSVEPPATPRPMIADVPKRAGDPIVQWSEPISPAESASVLARLATYPGVNVYWMGRSYLGQNIWAADVMLPTPAPLRSWAKESTLKAAIVYSGRQHANEVSSTSHIEKLGEQLVTEADKRDLLKRVNVVLHPITNPDGAQLSVDLYKITPDNLLHPGYHGSLSADVSAGQGEVDPIYPESRTRKQLIDGWLPDAFLNPHGYPSHEWVQPFSEYSGWVQARQSANSGRAWWIPRGWFTSMGYLRDETHPYSKTVAFAIRDRIVEAERGVPGLLPLEDRMNARYERYGQRWQPRDMFQPIVNGIRIYMSLKGSSGGGRGAAGGGQAGAAGAATPGSGGVSGLSPDVTWDAAYTEAPDETAHDDYMHLMASAGLAFDYVHLKYLAEGDLRVAHTEREAPGGVTWRVERPRPVLPPGVKPMAQEQ
jgi:hypothetical protein